MFAATAQKRDEELSYLIIVQFLQFLLIGKFSVPFLDENFLPWNLEMVECYRQN